MVARMDKEDLHIQMSYPRNAVRLIHKKIALPLMICYYVHILARHLLKGFGRILV